MMVKFAARGNLWRQFWLLVFSVKPVT